MTDLTEQWKKGELPSGYYYVKNEFGNIFPSDYSEDYDCISDTVIKDFFTEVSEITEVIAKVPPYDEIVKMEEEKRWYSENLHASTDKINQFKELLEECKEVFDECFSPSAKHGKLYKKIDEALR